jgi:uncharacterized protein YgfB (UPF0149 family)
MPEPSLPPYSEADRQARQLHLGIDAAELHGSLCGLISGGKAGDREHWLGLALADPDTAPVDPASALDRMYLASIEALSSPELGFALLLPDDDMPVSERGEALLAWCRGFLGGFGLAAGAAPAMSEESSEALADLGRIASSDLSYDDPDADEDALEEVAEFVRVAVMLLHSDCVLGPRHRRSLN